MMGGECLQVGAASQKPASHPPVAPGPPDCCSAPTSDAPSAPPSAASRGDPDAQHQGLLTDGAAGAWPAFSLVRKLRTRGHYPRAEVLCAVKRSHRVPPGLHCGAGPALAPGGAATLLDAPLALWRDLRSLPWGCCEPPRQCEEAWCWRVNAAAPAVTAPVPAGWRD